MVEKADVVYLAVPMMVILGVISWHGAHGVTQVLFSIMVLMIPLMFYMVYSEKFDEYWIRREESKPAQV